MNKGKKEKILMLVKKPSVFFLLFALFFCFEYIALGPFSYTPVNDNLDIFIPRLTSIGQQSETNWDPLFAMGIDRAANDVLQLNVGSSLFSFLPPWLAYIVLLLGLAYLAGFFTYKLCKEFLKLDTGPSIFAGVLFMHGLISFDIIPYILGYGILPAAIYFLEKLLEKEKKEHAWLLAIILGFMFGTFSSVPFSLPFTLLFIALWFFLKKSTYTVRNLVLLALFAASAIVVHVPAVLSLLANAPLSNRGGDFYQAGLPHYVRWTWELIADYWFPAVIIFFGAILYRIKQHRFIFLSLSFFLILFFSKMYQPFATLYGHLFRIIRDFGFDRFALLLPFIGALAAAVVLNHIQGSLEIKKRFRLQTVIIFLGIGVIIILNGLVKLHRGESWVRIGSYYANTQSPDINQILDRKKEEKPFRVAVIGDHTSGLRPVMLNMHGVETFGGDINIASKRYVSFFNAVTKKGPHIPKHSFYLFWEGSEEDEKEFQMDSNAFLNPALLSLANVEYLVSYLPITLDGFMLVAGPDEYSHTRDLRIREWMKKNIQENFKGQRVFVYHNDRVFPRLFLTENVRAFSSSDKLLTELEQTTAATLRNTVFLESELIGAVSSTRNSTAQPADIKIITYTSDEIVVEVETDAALHLVLTQNYNAAWAAYVNEKKQDIYPAYHTFMTIRLEPGTNTVVFTYEPDYAMNS